jgi:hypothetical protein
MASSRPLPRLGARVRLVASRVGHTSLGRVVLFALVLLAVSLAGVLFLKPQTVDSAVAPKPPNPRTGSGGDHWHTAFGVNICGEWLPNPPTFETAASNPNVYVGLNTHGDGYIDIHPYDLSEAGSHATTGLFFSYAGWKLSDSSLSVWIGPTADPTQKTWSNGKTCPVGTPDAGLPGVVRWAVDCRAMTGDPADYQLQDRQTLALTFLPATAPIPVPPSAAFPPGDGTGASAVATPTCAPTATPEPPTVGG